MLLTWHNLQFYQDVMRALRTAITGRRLEGWIAWFLEQQALGDVALL